MVTSTTLRWRPKPKQPCTARAAAFDPVTISVVGVIRRARVLSPPRDANGIPGKETLRALGQFHGFAVKD